jgi:hypothetical protein
MTVRVEPCRTTSAAHHHHSVGRYPFRPAIDQNLPTQQALPSPFFSSLLVIARPVRFDRFYRNCAQVIKEFGGWFNPCNQQVVARASACDVK